MFQEYKSLYERYGFLSSDFLLSQTYRQWYIWAHHTYAQVGSMKRTWIWTFTKMKCTYIHVYVHTCIIIYVLGLQPNKELQCVFRHCHILGQWHSVEHECSPSTAEQSTFKCISDDDNHSQCQKPASTRLGYFPMLWRKLFFLVSWSLVFCKYQILFNLIAMG